MAIKSEGREAWTAVTVDFQWLRGDYHAGGQWPDALAATARAMESAAWCVYWQQPHFVERDLYDGGPLRMMAVEHPQSAEAFFGWSLGRHVGRVSGCSR